MRLGVMVTVGTALEQVAGLAESASAAGHEVRIFATDEGTKLLERPRFAALAALPRVAIAYCALSADRLGVAVPPEEGPIRRGSQYDNALMAGICDKLVVL